MLTTLWKRSLCGLALFASLHATAQVTRWQIDPAHSDALFSVRHMGIANVHGSFSGVTGSAMLDDKNMAQSSVDATIDTTTVDTGNAMRDKDLRGPNFLDTTQFPTMHFVSTKLVQTNGQWQLIGNLTLHGVTRPVTLALETTGKDQLDPWGKTRRGFTATTTISRRDFGVVWSGTLKSGDAVVDNQVHITLEIELIRQ
jgi:polyisoprenoid-binding protein YceI